MGVAPVGEQPIGALAGTTGGPRGARHPYAVEKRPQLRRLVALARGDEDREGAPLAIAGEVDLGGETAPPAPQGLAGRAQEPPFPSARPGPRRAPAACWWARTTVESTLTFHSTSPTASLFVWAWASSLSHVPSRLQRMKRS